MESLFNKVSGNKKTPAQLHSCEFSKTFKNTCFIQRQRWSWSLLFKKLYIAVVLKKLCALVWYLYVLFIHFLYNLFFFSHNEVFEHFSMKKDPFNQIIRKWPPKGVFVDLLDKYLGTNAG